MSLKNYWSPKGVPLALGAVPAEVGLELSRAQYRVRLSVPLAQRLKRQSQEANLEALASLMDLGLLPSLESGWLEQMPPGQVASEIVESDLISLLMGEQTWPAKVAKVRPHRLSSLESWVTELMTLVGSEA